MKIDVPLAEDLQCKATIDLRKRPTGYFVDVEYKWPEWPMHWTGVGETFFRSEHEAKLAAARHLVDAFGRALQSARLSRESQDCVGRAISELARYRDSLSTQPQETETMPATTAKKAKGERRTSNIEHPTSNGEATQAEAVEILSQGLEGEGFRRVKTPTRACRDCNGTSYVDGEDCGSCGGRGFVPADEDDGVSPETLTPDQTGNSTPAGIAANDPEAIAAPHPDPLPGVPGRGSKRGKSKIEELRETANVFVTASREIRKRQKEAGQKMSDGMRPVAAELQSDPLRRNRAFQPPQSLAAAAVVRIGVAALRRHPLNRRPSEDSIVARRDSMKDRGQLEPLVVRPVNPGEDGCAYEILSGETRWLAAQELGWSQLDCRIVTCDDAEAYEVVLAHNIERQQLTVLERADALWNLTRPTTEGGHGLTREQAGAIVKGETGKPLGGPAVSNLVRLRELPEFWRSLVNAGELPQEHARLLTRYTHVPQIMAALEKEWKTDHSPKAHDYQRDDWTGPEFEDKVTGIAEETVRPMKKADSKYEYAPGRHFECDVATRQKLGIVEMETGVGYKNGREVFSVQEFATNVKLWDELHEKTKAGKKKKDAAKAGRDEPAPKKELTPAELKQRAAEAAKHLANRIKIWRHDWVRHLVAQSLADSTCQRESDVIEQFACWLMTAPLTREYGSDFDLDKALATGLGQTKKDAWKLVAGKTIEDLHDAKVSMVRHALTCEERDPRYPRLEPSQVDDAAAHLGLDLADAWKEMQSAMTSTGADQARFESFFLLFQTAQLDELGKDLGVFLDDAKTKDTKLRRIKASGRILPLPKCIKPLAGKATAKTAKKRAR